MHWLNAQQSKAWLADTGRFSMHFALWWTRKGRLHEKCLRDPLIVVFAVSRDLQKHHQWKTSPNTLVLSDASKALPLRVEGRGGTHHILDGWGSAQESVQGNGHDGGLWSPGWGMPEEKGTEKGRGFWHSRPSWSHFSLMDWWGASYVRPGGSQEPISAIIKSLCHSIRWNFSSLNRHLICEFGDFLASSNLHILRCKDQSNAPERTGVPPPKKDYLVFLSYTESANDDCDEYAFWDTNYILTRILDPVGNSKQFGGKKQYNFWRIAAKITVYVINGS